MQKNDKHFFILFWYAFVSVSADDIHHGAYDIFGDRGIKRSKRQVSLFFFG